ncbi:hypothetical protein [Saccharopolyspora hattusasensis]|uniref:hypothetical protein n=1 Tax=Saccharopolyspora hattusasensis TaxID=1128679 RepID=UPI003D98B74C
MHRDNAMETHVRPALCWRRVSPPRENRAAGYFTTSAGQWAAFVAAVKADEFDV